MRRSVESVGSRGLLYYHHLYPRRTFVDQGRWLHVRSADPGLSITLFPSSDATQTQVGVAGYQEIVCYLVGGIIVANCHDRELERERSHLIYLSLSCACLGSLVPVCLRGQPFLSSLAIPLAIPRVGERQ
jgi:hypothetical protein